MSITIEQVKKTAHLARLSLTEEEVLSTQNELNKILNWIDTLSEVDVTGVTPMLSTLSQPIPTREDEVLDGDNQDKILELSPESVYNYVCVPKVVE